MIQQKTLVPLPLQPSFCFVAVTFSSPVTKESIAYASCFFNCRTVANTFLAGLAGTHIHYIALTSCYKTFILPAHFRFVKKQPVVENPVFSSAACLSKEMAYVPCFRPHCAENHSYYTTKGHGPSWHCFITLCKQDIKEIFSVTSSCKILALLPP